MSQHVDASSLIFFLVSILATWSSRENTQLPIFFSLVPGLHVYHQDVNMLFDFSILKSSGLVNQHLDNLHWPRLRTRYSGLD
jgi:hypothetical protein